MKEFIMLQLSVTHQFGLLNLPILGAFLWGLSGRVLAEAAYFDRRNSVGSRQFGWGSWVDVRAERTKRTCCVWI